MENFITPCAEELEKHHNPEMTDLEKAQQSDRFQKRRSTATKGEANWFM